MNIFQRVKKAKVPRTAFDLSREVKMSARMGLLYPCFVQEVVPGDKFSINTESLVRLAPLIAPTMHRIDCYIHYFFIPNRILWEDWEDFITGEQEVNLPYDDIAYGDVDSGQLWDFLGIPTHDYTGTTIRVQTLPLRAYKAIYNEYYRDQNLVTELDITDDNTADLLIRAWEKDYFTSALADPIGGNEVLIEPDIEYADPAQAFDPSSPPTAGNIKLASPSGLYADIQDSASADIQILNIESITIDIEELRTAHRLYRWLERSERAGSRYAEHLLAHWGVNPKDARLDRPEYIGGGRSPVVISEVLNTYGSDDANAYPHGAMAGHGLNVGKTNQASKYCEEHGYIMGILSVMPKSAYYQGVPRHLMRQTNLDFYYPEFARLGEQAIEKAEIYVAQSMSSQTQREEWAYQSRYSEYKYAFDTVHGDFRDDLEFWHQARKFSSFPAFNQAFIECTPDQRIFNVDDQLSDNLWIQLYHNVIAVRPMPYWNDPTL